MPTNLPRRNTARIVRIRLRQARTKTATKVLTALVSRKDFVPGPVSNSDAVAEAVRITDLLLHTLKQ